ncbi:MarR family transcriptional regulator [Streptomyces sp. ID05-39B]|uniref:MarR family winged helix-turn-helix transcriptional regulator n=1 Tax=Streptomyces sp. ID05-39B TaxID=3028664 RepID=UPI0029ACDC26|nr:MarR family transcriptional regulator [Streptomyces sp. ID05-39B]MDX3529759.1 MarR family transcriptional regulator [Streptomyces sp. ID05-39B]
MTATQGQPVDGDDAGRPADGDASARGPLDGGDAAQGRPATQGEGTRGGGTQGGGTQGDGGRTDTVAAVVRRWQAVRPELDTGPVEIIGRVNRCAALLQQAEDAPLRRAGLSRAEFDLLGALRRTGHELTPGELARETFSSGTAVTKRVRALTERGLVERRGDTRDRRVAHLSLSEAGRTLIDGVLPEQLAYERAVLAALDADRQDELAGLLSELLSRLEEHTRALRI